ncbi:MAG: hypothetical protein RL762_1670 [Bacteroidota bacterium]|jgi:hypothetical protein
MRFQSRKDIFLWAVSGFVFVIYACVAIFIYLTEGDFSAVYGLSSVWLVLSVFIIWILPKTTHYTFLDDHLLCQSLGFKKRIYYNTFNKLVPSNGLHAGWKMSTAWNCLILRYNKFDELLISPQDAADFTELFEIKKAQFAKTN